jgi:hypothetical protein
MTSHEPFGHLQHKLWAKEGLGVKLAVWLPTTKSQESTRSWYVQIECDTLLESSWGELQVCFRPHPNPRSEPGVISSQSPGSPNRDNFPGIKAIWMRVLRSNAKNTIWGKVVASPESGPWWVKWVRVARGLSQHQWCFRRWTNPLVVGFDARLNN